MESLTEETWDVVIAGTGLVQALLALSLSQSGLKILHVDENTYYGGIDAGLSLDEAQSWAERHKSSTTFSPAQISQATTSTPKLASSRAYTLSLKPQIVYAQSKFLPSLVSSTINTQLEFLAVGSWWIYRQEKLQKVPSTREDVFADDSLSRRDKIGLMKFLRHVVQENTEDQQQLESESLQSALTAHFKMSHGLQLPISSLALLPFSVSQTPVELAVSRVRRHMTSMGYFGSGFGSVLAKYAGNAEIAQVCCRACAVGGATYLLDQAITDVTAGDEQEPVGVTLASGVTVKARHVVGVLDDLSAKFRETIQPSVSRTSEICHSINIISSPLRHLFPATSDNGPVPAAAIVMVVDTDDEDKALSQPPIYLQIHSEDTGECPSGQCIIYASTLNETGTDLAFSFERLTSAVLKTITAPIEHTSPPEFDTVSPEVLWTMSYTSHGAPITDIDTQSKPFSTDPSGKVISFRPRSHDIAFDDSVLDAVKAVWKEILGDQADEEKFLRFEPKPDGVGDD